MSKKGEVKSLHEKLVAINMVRMGQSKASVARELKVPESTLRGWYKNQNKILNQAIAEFTEKEALHPHKRPRLSDPSDFVNYHNQFRSGASYETSSRSSSPDHSDIRALAESDAESHLLNLTSQTNMTLAHHNSRVSTSSYNDNTDTPMDLTTSKSSLDDASSTSGSVPTQPMVLCPNFWNSYKQSMGSCLNNRAILDNILRRSDIGEIPSREDALRSGESFLAYLESERLDFVTSDEIFILQELLVKLRNNTE